MTLERSGSRFQTTDWMEIRALAREDAEGRRQILERLLRRYWPPVYAWLRRQGLRRDEAAEDTEGFFADVVLVRALFDRAAEQRGRLRNLLLTSLRRYRTDRHRQRQARGGTLLSLDQVAREEALLEGDGHAPPDDLFGRRWALRMLEEALRRCEAHYRGCGKSGHWTLFEARDLAPAVSGREPPAVAELAPAHGFASTSSANAALQVVRDRARALLREVVGETVDDPADAEEELAEVQRLLSG